MRSNILIGLAAGLFVLDRIFVLILFRNHPDLLHSDVIVSWPSPWLRMGLSAGIVLVAASAFPRLSRVGLVVVTIGLLGNSVNLLLYGTFSDYIPTGLSFFNLSDVTIVAGIALVLFSMKQKLRAT